MILIYGYRPTMKYVHPLEYPSMGSRITTLSIGHFLIYFAIPYYGLYPMYALYPIHFSYLYACFLEATLNPP